LYCLHVRSSFCTLLSGMYCLVSEDMRNLINRQQYKILSHCKSTRLQDTVQPWRSACHIWQAKLARCGLATKFMGFGYFWYGKLSMLSFMKSCGNV
jgi:hypothetical protein